MDGGTFKATPSLDPITFQEIMVKARSGQDVESEVFAAERMGKLTRNASAALLKMGTDTRFGIADDQIRRALKVGEFVGSPAVHARNAEALTLYEIWKVEHPNATLDEARAEASFQAKRALIFDDKEITAFQLPPKFAVYESDQKTLKVNETRLELTRALRDGNISESELDRELDLLEQFEYAQKAQAIREKLRADQEAESSK